MDIQTDSHGNPLLTQFSEEGFVDLTFRIRDLIEDAYHYRFRLSAVHDNETVGMNIVLVKGVSGGFDSNMNLIRDNVYRLGVRFQRSGGESDRLVSVIAELYGFADLPTRMVDEETFTAIALHQGDVDLDREPVQLKLFGKDSEPFDEEAYYESFFNVDLANELVCWNEKDPDYRTSLLRALAAK